MDDGVHVSEVPKELSRDDQRLEWVAQKLTTFATVLAPGAALGLLAVVFTPGLPVVVAATAAGVAVGAFANSRVKN